MSNKLTEQKQEEHARRVAQVECAKDYLEALMAHLTVLQGRIARETSKALAETYGYICTLLYKLNSVEPKE